MSCKENPTWSTTYSKYISSTSTCFGRIYAHHQELQLYVYNIWYLLFFIDDCLLSWLDWLDWNNPTRTTDCHLIRIISTNCCIHTVVPPDDGHRYARNMYMLTKYTKNKLCIKLGFLYTIISRCAVNEGCSLVSVYQMYFVKRINDLSVP